jgi:VanZ family protein
VTDANRRMSSRTRYRRWVGAFLACYWPAMFVGTHMPLPPGMLPGESDKLAHFAAYALLTFTLAFWLSTGRRLDSKRSAIVLAVVAAYAAVDELLQIPVGRHADWRDGAADLAGAIAGLLASIALQWRAATPEARFPPGRG